MLILPYVKMFSNASYIWNVIWLKKYNFITLFIDIESIQVSESLLHNLSSDL